MSPSDPVRWQRITEIFGEAMDAEPSAREATVQAACLGDPAIAAEVRRLLEMHERSNLALDRGLPAAIRGIVPSLTRMLEPGQRLAGRFDVVRFVASGGMGDVYQAFDRELNATIAIKAIRAEIAGEPGIVDRFKREIGLARQVTHPNVCRIFEFNETADEYGNRIQFLTMEYLEGETLAQLIRREGALPLDKAHAMIDQMTGALDAAHAAGVIHRDFKSSNIFLSKDRSGAQRVVVTDFGLARAAAGSGATGVTASAWGGTPAYMAPEQLDGGKIGLLADVYALGVVMFEMATGSQPFQGHSPIEVAVRRLRERAPRARSVDPKIPANWDAVISRCLEIDPRDRFQSAGEAADALAAGSSWLKRRPIMRAGRASWWGRAAAALALCGLGGWGLNNYFQAKDRPPAAVGGWYREGLAALHEGNLATSRRALQKVTSMAPAWPIGQARLAQVYFELDQPDQAREAILQATHAMPLFYSGSGLVKAIQSLAVRDFPAATSGFRTIADSQSGAARLDALMDQARALELAGKPSEAIAATGKILTADPDSPAANLLRARLGILSSDKADAIQAYFDKAREGFRALNRIEAMAETDLHLSKWLFKQKDAPAARRAAVQCLETARLAQSPYTEAQALFHLARIADTSSETKEAERLLAQAREIASRERFGNLMVQGSIDLGIQLFTQEKIDLALMQFQNAVTDAGQAHDPQGAARARHQSGECLLRLARLTEAMAAFEQANSFYQANRFPRESMRARLGMAAVLDKRGEYVKAAAAIAAVKTEAADLGDLDLGISATARLANYSYNIGEFPGALENYREWLKLARKGGIVQDICAVPVSIARTLTNLGRFAEAHAELKALAEDRKCASAQQVTRRGVAEGQVLAEEGSYTEALAHYRTMQAAARANQQTQTEALIQQQICNVSTVGEPPDKAREECAKVARKPGGAKAAGSLGYAAADRSLREGKLVEARSIAETARAGNLKRGSLDDALYSTLIRGQAEARLGDIPALKESRIQLLDLRRQLASRWGDAAVNQYLTRPLYGSRWKEIFGNAP